MANKQIKQLEKSKQSSKSAVSQFTFTMEKLKQDNAELNVVEQNLQSEIEGLVDAREDALLQMEQNRKTMHGIEAIINGNI